MSRSKDNKRMVLECKFGKLVCDVMRDDDEYKEFAIDLYRNDGKVVQVCVVGTVESEHEYCDAFSADANRELAKYHGMVHTCLYDGEDPDSCQRLYTEPYGGGWWGEEEA